MTVRDTAVDFELYDFAKRSAANRLKPIKGGLRLASKDRALIDAARKKLDRGFPPLDREEREALNFDLAITTAGEILKEMKEVRHRNENVVSFTQGDFNAIRQSVKFIIAVMYGLDASHCDKHQELEAKVSELRRRILDLEEAAPHVEGTFDEKKAYRAGGIVALGGASFIARKDNPGPCPGVGWQLVAMQGKRGQQGIRGPAGPKVEKLEADDKGTITLTNTDGSTATLDLKDALKRIKGL